MFIIKKGDSLRLGEAPKRFINFWVATQYPNPAKNSEDTIALVPEWSDRKRKLFKAEPIRKAWQRLSQQNWLTRNLEQGGHTRRN